MINSFKVLEFDEIKKAVAKCCAFSLGKKIVLELEPHYDELIVKRELQRAKEALTLVVRFGSMPFDGLRDITSSLQIAMKDSTCNPLDLLDVAAHAYCCRYLIEYFKQADIQTPELDDLVHSLDYSVALSKEIERCIEPSGDLSDNASVKLKGLRRSLVACEGNIHKAAQSFIKNNSARLMDTITTLRNDRVVVLVKNTEKNSIKGLIHGESASGQTVFMEPEVLLTLNNERQTIISHIEEEIQRILYALSQEVKAVAPAYLANLSTLALMDSYNAKALWGKANDGTVAEIGDRLILLKARHPLIDPKVVVANTYRILPPCNTLLITGPNTGGKTVSLKIIGLFVLMSLCGMPVSCEEAMIPLFDQVFEDIGDNQSIVNALSTFSAHLKKLAYICNHATERSLILLDELGGGTDPVEGECLAIATLDYLRKIKAMVVATTHYSRLKTYGKKHEDIRMASVQFDLEKMQPTYRYVEGLTGQSNALDIATKFGLNEEIVRQAKQLKISGRTKEEALMEDLEKAILANRQQQELLESQIAEENRKQEELQRKISYYTDEKERLLERARFEADGYIAQIKEEADHLLQEMRVVQTGGKLHEGIEVRHRIEQMTSEEAVSAEDEEHEFSEGDYVLIKRANQRGTIEWLDKRKAVVDVNGLKMHVKLKDIAYLGEKPEIKREKSRYQIDRPTSLSFELNLIGQRVDEAMGVLDKYIDDCVLMNAPYIRIIHGFGTGALRKAVWQRLKANPQVDEIRFGMQQEGGSGATIVTLKKKK